MWMSIILHVLRNINHLIHKPAQYYVNVYYITRIGKYKSSDSHTSTILCECLLFAVIVPGMTSSTGAFQTQLKQTTSAPTVPDIAYLNGINQSWLRLCSSSVQSNTLLRSVAALLNFQWYPQNLKISVLLCFWLRRRLRPAPHDNACIRTGHNFATNTAIKFIFAIAIEVPDYKNPMIFWHQSEKQKDLWRSFWKKNWKKIIVYWSEMARNATEIHFRSSKMGGGGVHHNDQLVKHSGIYTVFALGQIH